MISIDEIERTILELEQKDTSYAVCEKLCWLYICRDHLKPVQIPETKTVSTKGTSPFLAAANNKPIEHVLQIIDEHMEAIRILYPKEYDAILEKLG